MKTDDHWWESAVGYELYIDRFAGDFRGLTGKLDYLHALGVNLVHLLPFFESPMVDDGYDVSDYRKIRPEFGTMEDFKAFAAAARAKGIRIMVDLVLNHVSEKHRWFQSARQSPDSPYRDYFLWSKTGKEFPDAQRPFKELTPENWVPTGNGEYYFATFYAEQPDLNWDNPAVEKEIENIMELWVEAGVDVFRLDAASHLIKREGTNCKNLPETHAVLKRLRAFLNRTHPDVALLAETHSPTEIIRDYFGNDDECQLVYHFPLSEHIFRAVFFDDKTLLKPILKKSKGIPPHSRWATFLRNHDELSLSTLPREDANKIVATVDPSGKYSFHEGYAISMRLAEIFRDEPKKILAAFKMLFAVPGVPIIYYGEEIGMRNAEINPPPRDTRKYVRGQFDWKEAEKQMADPKSLFSQMAKLIKKKKAS